jgi:hypothetical protein
VVVFVSTFASVTNLITSVTYGGVGLTRLSGGAAQDAAGELGRMDAFFLGSGLSAGNQTITVNRTNNATVMYAAAATVTAGADTAVPTATIVLLQGDQALAVQSVNDTSPGQNSVRYAGAYSGLNAPPAAGTGSTLLNSIDIGNYGSALARETTAGQGARNVGFTGASDDVAAVHLAIRELVPRTETPFLGTFTLTGNAADLVKAGAPKVMTGDRGAFTFTGNAADLRHNPRETPIVGAFTLTGQPADVRHNVRIEGGTGSFSFTGNAATLTKAGAVKAITADRGIFTLTGNQAGLAHNVKIDGGRGAFTFTGNEAGLAHGVRITGERGAFTFTGNNATLTKAAADELSALVGTFTLTGNGATLARSRAMLGARGQFTLTGQAASLLQGYRATGDRGQFLLTGNPAALTVAYSLLGARGAFTLTGNPAGLSDTDLLDAAAGVFILTGNNANLAKSGAGGRRRVVFIF